MITRVHLSALPLILALFLVPVISRAATLSVSPASGSHTVGDTFTLTVRVSSSDQAMNAASGVVKFPTDLLQITSLSKSSSIIGLWVQEPSFSNSAGTVNFEGVVLNPGFTGSSGNVISITFKAKSAGDAAVSISGGSVLANDGNGTEILTGSSDSTITVEDAAQPTPSSNSPAQTKSKPKAATSEVVSTELQAPIITSFPASVSIGGVATVVGSSIYPGATARLTLQRGNDDPLELDGIVAGNGTFSFTQAHTLPPGNYSGSVSLEKDGIQSAPSASFVIQFEGKPLMARLMDMLNQPGVILAFSVIVAFILGMFCVRYFLGVVHSSSDKNMHATLRAVDMEVHKAFLKLRGRINKALEELEKESETRELTSAEKRFVREMTSSIKDTESLVDADIRGGGQ